MTKSKLNSPLSGLAVLCGSDSDLFDDVAELIQGLLLEEGSSGDLCLRSREALSELAEFLCLAGPVNSVSRSSVHQLLSNNSGDQTLIDSLLAPDAPEFNLADMMTEEERIELEMLRIDRRDQA